MLIEEREKARLALAEVATQAGISCENARALAEEIRVSYEAMGEAANDLGIKIIACQLGCF